MNELILEVKAADWRRLKSPVLDSVSSPITRCLYNLGLDDSSCDRNPLAFAAINHVSGEPVMGHSPCRAA